MDTKHLLSLSVSLQNKIWLPIETDISVYDALNMIQTGNLETEVEKLRDYLHKGDMESFSMYKRSLPAVTFCGCFDRQRKTENLKNYNSVLVLDIDKLEGDILDRTAAILEADPYVFAYWRSPSGKGFKGLVFLEYSFHVKKSEIAATHKKAFQKISGYFYDQYDLELDESGCDITRLCFLSSDPELVIKQQTNPFVIAMTDRGLRMNFSNRQKGRNPGKKALLEQEMMEDKRRLQFKNNPEEKKELEAVIDYLCKNELSITASYEQWYKVAYALAEAFTYKIGLDYYLQLCALDGNQYDEQASRAMFYYCYKNADGRIKLNSLLYYAVKQGFNPPVRQRDEFRTEKKDNDGLI